MFQHGPFKTTTPKDTETSAEKNAQIGASDSLCVNPFSITNVKKTNAQSAIKMFLMWHQNHFSNKVDHTIKL